jgi:hypothetical protein
VQLSIVVDFFVVYIYIIYKVKFSIIIVMVATCDQIPSMLFHYYNGKYSSCNFTPLLKDIFTMNMFLFCGLERLAEKFARTKCSCGIKYRF